MTGPDIITGSQILQAIMAAQVGAAVLPDPLIRPPAKERP